jgi:hypothetical protein
MRGATNTQKTACSSSRSISRVAKKSSTFLRVAIDNDHAIVERLDAAIARVLTEQAESEEAGV